MFKFFAFLSLLIPLCAVTPVFGANVTVTGTVVCDGDPCIGAAVQEYSNVLKQVVNNGTAADADGKFKLDVGVGSSIQLSYVGQKTQILDVSSTDGKKDFGTIKMEVNSKVLGEVTKKECSLEGAKEQGIKARDINNNCAPSACIEPRWKLKGSGKSAKCKEQKCKFDNGTGEWVENGDAWVCKLEKCKNGYKKEFSADGSGEYCREMLNKCTDAQAKEHPNATKTGIKKGTEICVAQECKCGFSLENEKCVAWAENKECTADTKPRLPDDAASAKMICDNDKAVCKIDKCVSEDYELKDNKCESKNKQPCTPGDKNATAGEYKNRGGKLVCVITACKKNYSVDKDNNKCVAGMVLSEEDQKARVAELEENARKMKEKEQSMENKLLGAAGMGMTGMGLMQSMSAGAEQKADEAAELDMAAYLATMHCNYAPGKNVKGGEKEVELPGANSLLPLYTEYVALANDLKVRKEALGLRPGIESEAILDGATSGLYDDVALGKTSGAYTSLARALSDPNGEDAKKWAAQKEETAKDKKTGTTLAAVGAIGSAVANIAINSGDDKKEKSDEIEAEYDKKRQEIVSDSVVMRVSPETPIVLSEEDNAGITSLLSSVTGGTEGDEKSQMIGSVLNSVKTAKKNEDWEIISMPEMIANQDLTAKGQSVIDGYFGKMAGRACLFEVVLQEPFSEKDTFKRRRAEQKAVEKYIASKIKSTSVQVDASVYMIRGGGCQKDTPTPCPYVKLKLKCIADSEVVSPGAGNTEWLPLAGASTTILYHDIYQSTSRGDYIYKAIEACTENKGTWKEDIRVYTVGKNTSGTYNTFFDATCDFGTPDNSSGSTRCKYMCVKAGVNCVQSGSFGNSNYTSCFIRPPSE